MTTATAAHSTLPPQVSGLLGARAQTLQEHRRLVGALPTPSPSELLRMVAESGLTGRGGGHFSTARKLALIAGTRNAMLIGNGAEGEPASTKDRLLLGEAPHLVLDGLALAGRIIGNRSARLAAPSDVLEEVVAPALTQRRDRVRLIAVPEGFVNGQETAVAAAAEGRPARPVTLTAPLPARGVSGRPTLVLNVETLAHIALIARYGAAWWRDLGTDDDPGTRLVTVSGAVRWPGVWEAPGGSNLADVLAAAGGANEPVQALLVGGYHGGWVPWRRDTTALPLTRAGLQEYATGPGAGVVVALPARCCGLRMAARVAAYLAGESAGQCGPCRNGLPAIAEHLDALARGQASPETLSELRRLGRLVDGRGACRHPDGTARFVNSTLATFIRETEHHLAGRCTAPADEPADDARRLPWPPN